jgi:hypothetical protein
MNDSKIIISTMTFTFYKSDRVQSNDAFAASFVRVHLVLKKADVTLNRHSWILLQNVIYTQQLGSLAPANQPFNIEETILDRYCIASTYPEVSDLKVCHTPVC